MTDAFEFAGITVDEFDKQLAGLSSQEERATLITETLSEIYGEAGQAFQATNKDIIDSRNATLRLQKAFAKIGEAVEPVLTMLINLLALVLENIISIIDKFDDFSQLKSLFEPANKSLQVFKSALQGFTETTASGLFWIFNEILVPLGKFVITDILPLWLEGIAVQFRILDELLQAVYPMLEWLWVSFLQPIALWTGGIIVSILSFIIEQLNNFAIWIGQNQPIVQTFVGILGAIAIGFGAVQLALTTFATVASGFGAVVAFITSPLGLIIGAVALLTPSIVKFKEEFILAFEKIGEIATTIYNEFLKPVIDSLIQLFISLWNDSILPLWGNVRGFLDGLVELILVLWNNVLAPLIGWFLTTFQPVFMTVWTIISETAFNAIGFIMDQVGLFLSYLDGVIEILIGVFTGDWERVWNGIKQIFSSIGDGIKNIWNVVIDHIKAVIEPLQEFFITYLLDPFKHVFTTVANFFVGIINGMIDGFEKFVNFFIDGINEMIENINNLSEVFGLSFSTIPSFSVGRIPEIQVKSRMLSPDMPPLPPITQQMIPPIAQGMALPPTRAFANVSSEPQNTTTTSEDISQAIKIALGDILALGDKEIILNLDGTTLARLMVNLLATENKRIGTRLVN